jgi:hypothetical protein
VCSEGRKSCRKPRKLPDQQRQSRCDIDLYAVLPKAKSEPIYVKSDWERELGAALRESRAMAS